jgi:CRP-like cAMP-binding protein
VEDRGCQRCSFDGGKACLGRLHRDLRSLKVRKDGKDVMPLKPGHLIGRGLALTGEPSTLGATFAERARYFSWPLASIRAFLDKRPDLRRTLQSLVNRDLAAKMEELSNYLPGKSK